MKIFLCFIYFFNICYCQYDSQQRGRPENYWREDSDDVIYGHQQHDPIQRPCSLHDLDCIRSYFAHNSRCSPVHGPAPDPYRMKTLSMQLPHANMTFTRNDIQIKGFNNFKINEFYINIPKDKLVLEVEFQSLVVYSAATVISYHRKGKEPLELSDYSIIEYRSISLTLTIPHVKDIKLSNGAVYSYITDAAPKFELGPVYTTSKDPIVISRHRMMGQDISTSLKEAFVTQGPVFMSIFIQNIICDFSLQEIRYK